MLVTRPISPAPNHAKANFSSTDDEPRRVYHRARKVLVGLVAQAPTPSLLSPFDVGLLYFLSEKQRHLHEVATTAQQLSESSSYAPLRLCVEFFRFVVEGAIGHTEKVDEAVVRQQQVVNDLNAQLRNADLEIQHTKKQSGTMVEQVLSHHFPSKLHLPKSHAPHVYGSEVLHRLTEEYHYLRQAQRQGNSALRALLKAQRMLHGSGAEIPQMEAQVIVDHLPIPTTFRKAYHSLRDALLELDKNFESESSDVPLALKELLDFLLHVDAGMTAALSDLEATALALRKQELQEEKERKHSQLMQLEANNKRLSMSALKRNDTTTQQVLLQRGADHPTARARHVNPNHAEMSQLLQMYCTS